MYMIGKKLQDELRIWQDIRTPDEHEKLAVYAYQYYRYVYLFYDYR